MNVAEVLRRSVVFQARESQSEELELYDIRPLGDKGPSGDTIALPFTEPDRERYAT
jgi:hypothetical protein